MTLTDLALNFEVRLSSSLTKDERAEADAVDHAAFAGEEDDGLVWSSGDWLVLGYLEGRMVAAAGLVDRIARVGDQPVHLCGVGGVAVLPEWQGKGVGHRLMLSVNQAIRDIVSPEFGLLVCDPVRLSFYGRAGWQKVTAPLWFDQPGGKQCVDWTIAVLPCKKTDWPSGEIDLCGLPW